MSDCQNSVLNQCIIRRLGRQKYEPIWDAMRSFTATRSGEDKDEFWFVEHEPVFTQGQAGKQEHILNPADIPVVQVDRGGQVTYHGPGQQVVYCMIDLKRRKWGVRQLVSQLEKTIIDLLQKYAINASAQATAPGVYVNQEKICSLGLRIKNGRSFHGLALNVNMDKGPFTRINPCGYEGLAITQVSDLGGPKDLKRIEKDLKESILKNLDYPNGAIEQKFEINEYNEKQTANSD